MRDEAVISCFADTALTVIAFLVSYFTGFAIVVELAFEWYARRYPIQDNYRTAGNDVRSLPQSILPQS